MSEDYQDRSQKNLMAKLKQALSIDVKKLDLEEEEEKLVVAGASSKDQQECKTPTSNDRVIPAAQSCPPTPRKKVHYYPNKRRQRNVQFFETLNRDEVEAFFLSTSLQVSAAAAAALSHPEKKRRMSF